MRKVMLFFMVSAFCMMMNVSVYGFSCFRCGSRLVCLGDSKYEVLDKCGAPTSESLIGVDNQSLMSLQEHETFFKIDEWIYDGRQSYKIRHQNIFRLIFRGNILKEIERLIY
jgi:hypothetical protein